MANAQRSKRQGSSIRRYSISPATPKGCSHFRNRKKRHLLNFIRSNCTWEDGEVVATFRQPFIMLAETASAAIRIEAGKNAKLAKSEIWLGDLDSNQGCPGQSREFYR